jgi:hypothetical protein
VFPEKLFFAGRLLAVYPSRKYLSTEVRLPRLDRARSVFEVVATKAATIRDTNHFQVQTARRSLVVPSLVLPSL